MACRFGQLEQDISTCIKMAKQRQSKQLRWKHPDKIFFPLINELENASFDSLYMVGAGVVPSQSSLITPYQAQVLRIRQSFCGLEQLGILKAEDCSVCLPWPSTPLVLSFR
jgi:hypothetical protein